MLQLGEAISATLDLPSTVAAPSSRFQENHRIVVRGLRSALEVMDAVREIYESEQWAEAYPSFEAYCEAAAQAAGVGFGYSRAMQMVEAARRREALDQASTPVELPPAPEAIEVEVSTPDGPRSVPLGRCFKSEKPLRALPPQGDPLFVPVAELAVAEAQRRGMQNGPSEGLVKSVTQDIKALQAHNLAGFEDVQRMFAPWGTFNRHTVTSRRVQSYRYQFESPVVLGQAGTGQTKLFKDLKEAIAFFQEWCLPSRRLKTVGCLTCAACNVQGMQGHVTCTAAGEPVGEPVKLTEVWAKVHCSDYVPLEGGVIPTPIGPQADSAQHPLPAENSPKYTHSAGMLGHQGANGGAGGTNERYTPEYIWKPALEAWRRTQFDLDPSTTDTSPIPAAVRYTKERSGLLHPWDVLGSEPIFMWGNFPYSLNTQFVPRLERYWEEGWIDHAFILEKTDNRTDWYQTLLRICSAFCLIDHAIAHVGETGKEDNGGFFGSTLFYLGSDPGVFRDAYDFLGPICQVTTPEHFAY